MKVNLFVLWLKDEIEAYEHELKSWGKKPRASKFWEYQGKLAAYDNALGMYNEFASITKEQLRRIK